jgi:N-acetylglutamate synthase-like GNAT family acetyltransferase
MRFTLRPARSDDAPATSRLLAELGYRVDPRALRVGLERAGLAEDAQVIAMTEGDELVGLAALALAPGATGRLELLVVSEPRRRQGAGRILLAAAEAVASGCGCSALEAGAALPGGRRFLREAGFDHSAGRLVKRLTRDLGAASSRE